MILVPRYCPQCGVELERRIEDGKPRDVCPGCAEIFYRNPLPVVAVVLVNEEHEVLLVKRNQEPHKGAWSLPMGFAEINETIAEAARRELREEAGIEGEIRQLLDVDSHSSDYYGDMLIVTFEVVKTSGAEKAGDDAAAVAYFPIEDLPQLAFSANEKAIRVCSQIHREEWAQRAAREVGAMAASREVLTTPGRTRQTPGQTGEANSPRHGSDRAGRCPLLRQADVSFCSRSPFRKMIPRSLVYEPGQRCSSPAYIDCPSAKDHLEGRELLSRCPFLEESQVQYCTASPVTRFIPYTEQALSRCDAGAYRYCQHYLQRARPRVEERRRVEPEKIPVPPKLRYSRNHLWLDAAEDGSWHVGVDAFLVRVLGEIERVSFTARTGVQKPAIVLRSHGVDLSLAFPFRMNVTAWNVVLRSHPNILLSDPYRSGWLYEGTDANVGSEGRAGRRYAALLRGKEAEQWMQDEIDSMSLFLDELCSYRQRGTAKLLTDGGQFCSNLARYLERDELLYLFACFFRFQ